MRRTLIAAVVAGALSGCELATNVVEAPFVAVGHIFTGQENKRERADYKRKAQNADQRIREAEDKEREAEERIRIANAKEQKARERIRIADAKEKKATERIRQAAQKSRRVLEIADELRLENNRLRNQVRNSKAELELFNAIMEYLERSPCFRVEKIRKGTVSIQPMFNAQCMER